MAILIRRLTLLNYKSIASCEVELHDLCLLVGLNGVGKSNFLDALRLVSESLRTTLEYAIRQRGGIKEVRRKSGGHPTHFAIRLHVNLGDGQNALYAFRVGALPGGDFLVQQEKAVISSPNLDQESIFYEVRDGELVAATEDLRLPSKVVRDRLYLAAVSGDPVFRLLYDALSRMGFYNVNPAVIRNPQLHSSGEILDRDGGNIAAVIKRLENVNGEALRRIHEYLQQIVPGFEGVSYRTLGPQETLEFRQRVPGAEHAWRFFADSMSDGTLRALGVLTALFQSIRQVGGAASLVGIEEPESTVHPGAARVLMDALLEASAKTQVIFTTHSPDLLDHEAIQSENIRAVSNFDGTTVIAPADNASISAIKDKLYTPGDLLRKNQLQPDPRRLSPKITQAELFKSL